MLSKPTSLFLTGLLFLVLQAQQCRDLEQLYSVDMQFTTTEQYCGGAPPIQEILDELETPKPMKHTSLYLYNEDDVLILSIKTDERGGMTDSLTAGKYFVRKALKTANSGQNEELQACLQQWEQRVLDSFVVQTDTAMERQIYLMCNPCYPPAP